MISKSLLYLHSTMVRFIIETYDKAGQGGGGGSVNIFDNTTKGDTRKNVVPNPLAVNAFVMSLIPVDIKSDTEFDNLHSTMVRFIMTIPFGVSKTESKFTFHYG